MLPTALDLPGPSRRIRVEPLRVRPSEPAPAEAPREEPAPPLPEREPVEPREPAPA